MKNVYAIQPYQLVSKNAKSLALVIPAPIVKKYKIDTSTIFALKGNDVTSIVTLQSELRLSEIVKESLTP